MLNRMTLKLKLETVTPVFAGSGDKLDRLGYVLDEKAGKVFVIDELKFPVFLAQKGLLERFAVYISKTKHPSLQKWLADAGIRSQDYHQFTKYSAQWGHHKENLNDISLCAKLPGGIPYIPGSAIKGAIRTALAAALITRAKRKGKDHQLLRKWQELVSLADKGEFKKNNGQQIEKILFNHNSDLFQSEPGDTLADCLRGILVSDTEGFARDSLCILQKCDLTITSKLRAPKPISLYREYIKPGYSGSFTITLDFTLLAALGIASVQDFLNLLDEGMARLYGRGSHLDLGYHYQGVKIESLPQGRGHLFCLGGGTGFQSKTVVYSLAPSFKEGVNLTKKYLNFQFKKHKHFKDEGMSPRTLKLAQWQGKMYNVGWCLLEVAK